MTIAVHKTEYSNNRTATFAPAGFANMQITNRLIGETSFVIICSIIKTLRSNLFMHVTIGCNFVFCQKKYAPLLGLIVSGVMPKTVIWNVFIFGLRRPHSRTETGTNLPPITSLFVLNGKQISHFTATILSKQNCELSPLSWVSPTKQDADLSGQDFIRIIG